MWSSLSEKASKGLTDALEKGTKAFSQAELHSSQRFAGALEKSIPSKNPTEQNSKLSQNNCKTVGPEEPTVARLAVGNIDKEKVLQNLQFGWSSIVETTKQTVSNTKQLVEVTNAKLEENFALRKKGFYKRDRKLPLDAEALRDAEVQYITDRIVIMSHPAMQSKDFPMITAERKLAAVGHMLARRHDGRFLVYNLSEVEYDTSILDDQVLTFSFPGSPAPPLGLLLKLLISLENWMKADDRNVAVVHCLTGKGRSSMVVASFLCWIGEAGFGNINEAIGYIAKCKRVDPMILTIPSQRRYAAYFKNVLDGVKPSQPPLLLKRIIMSEAPRFAKGPQKDPPNGEGAQDHPQDDETLMGCAPYLQIFKAGKLIYTAAATMNLDQQPEDLPFVQVCDGTIPFEVDQVVSGDILVRARHLTRDNKRISMFRAAWHTGYCASNVLRLTKAQLDGACTDPRYLDDFFVDLIFEKVSAEVATKHIEEQREEGESDEQDKVAEDKGAVVKATAFDIMLSGDSRIWEIISNRKKRNMKQMGKSPPTRGPTIGNRRKENKGADSKNDQDKTKTGETSKQAQFSIGDGFSMATDDSTPETPEVPEKDSLMEALNALDIDDRAEKSRETGAILFDTSPNLMSDDISVKMEETPSATNESSKSNNETETLTLANSGHDLLEDIDDDDLAGMDALLASVENGIDDVDLEGFDENDDLGLDDFENMLNS